MEQKIAVTGYEGTVGTELLSHGCLPLECDITNLPMVQQEMDDVSPDIVIHCAAITDVGYCEEHKEEAIEANLRGTANVVTACGDRPVIFISSDHVFSGKRRMFGWMGYNERDTPSPVNTYGFTKFAAERIVQAYTENGWVIRTSRLFNYNGMAEDIGLLRSGERVEFTDLIKRSFLHVNHFVDSLMYICANLSETPKLLHVAGNYIHSYAHFWQVAATELGLDQNLVIARKHEIEDYPRPFYGGLNISLAKRSGTPLYGIVEGLELVKDGK